MRYRPEIENDDGWSDWIHPLPGYRLMCCDCGLVHNMEFRLVEDRIEFRANRNVRATAASRRERRKREAR